MSELLSTVISKTSLLLGNRFLRIEDDLILADLHLGKTMHFRKAGLPVPAAARERDQAGLMALLKEQSPKRLIVLGDLFHSDENSEVEELRMITSQFPSIDFVLIRGNHDVLEDAIYRDLDFDVMDEMLLGEFHLTHEPLEVVSQGQINMHGHIHPGIVLHGKGRQHIKLPCFHFNGTHFCLPAFGALTGLMKVKTKKKHQVYGVVEGTVIKLQ